jgi:PBP1b-binding outer membrane lipoprotein LpoB
MKRVIVIVLVVLLLSACGQQSALEDMELSIADYEKQIEQLTKKVEIRNDLIGKQRTTIKNREEEIEANQF